MNNNVNNGCFINGIQYKCRTCFDPGQAVFSLTAECSNSKTWYDLLKEIAQFQTNEDEQLLPTTVCCKCLDKLISYYDFIQQIKNVNKKYSQLLGRGKDGPSNGSGDFTNCLAESAKALPLEMLMPEIKLEEEQVVPYDIVLSENYNLHKLENIESVKQLQNSIEELKANSFRQNTIIMEALAKQTVLLEKLLGKEKNELNENIRKMFPVQTIVDLADINNKIMEANRDVYIRCMKSLIKGHLHKSLTEIVSLALIIDSNIDGIKGKHSLKSFKRFFSALLDAVQGKGEQYPEKAIRKALRLIKKRHFHSICVSKKKEQENTSQEEEILPN